MSKNKQDSQDSQDRREPRINQVIGHVEKAFGKGSILTLDGSVATDIAVIRSGSLALDEALGVGGYPRGRIVEVYGPESSGKTTLALHAIAQVQKAGGIAAFIDAEHAFDVRYARSIGVDTARLLVSQPDFGEQALDIVELLTKTQCVELIVIDSVAALVPRAEIEGDMGDAHVGLHARLMSQSMRKLTGLAHRSETTLLFINQLRQKVGVVFGSPEVTTGGNALKFFASVRVDVRRSTKLTEGELCVGNRTRVKIVKNKLAAPFAEAEFDIRWGTGIDAHADLLEVAARRGVVEQSGSYYGFAGKNFAQGKERAKEAIAAQRELRDALLEATRRAMAPATPGLARAGVSPAEAPSADCVAA